MEYILEYKSFKLNEAGKKIKKYKKVKVGDTAFENPDGGGSNEIGKIVWKGSFKELKKSEYESFIQEWEDNSGDSPEGYDLVVVDVPRHGEVLMNYNNDPSGAVVYK